MGTSWEGGAGVREGLGVWALHRRGGGGELGLGRGWECGHFIGGRGELGLGKGWECGHFIGESKCPHRQRCEAEFVCWLVA